MLTLLSFMLLPLIGRIVSVSYIPLYKLQQNIFHVGFINCRCNFKAQSKRLRYLKPIFYFSIFFWHSFSAKLTSLLSTLKPNDPIDINELNEVCHVYHVCELYLVKVNPALIKAQSQTTNTLFKVSELP